MPTTAYFQTRHGLIVTDAPEIWAREEGAKRLSAKAGKAAWQAECASTLAFLKPGDTVHVVIRHVSSSGMSRTMTLHVVTEDGSIRDITTLAAGLLGENTTKDIYLRVTGCGMDMAWNTVNRVAYRLFGRDGALNSRVI